MMSRNKSNSSKKSLSFSSLMANNKIVFIFSLIVAVIFWCVISMSQTTEIEKEFQGVKVTIDDSLPKNNNLEIFGDSEFFVDVTVKGLSYLINDHEFAHESIVVTASCSAVSTAGTYDLPLVCSIKGVSEEVEVVNLSARTVKATFDEKVTKTFAITEQIEEKEDFSIPEGLVKENPRLSVTSIDVSGPAREISKVSAVKAYIELSGEMKSTITSEAEIIFESSSGKLDSSYFTLENTEPVYITIPLNQVGTYKTAIDFIGIPQAFRGEGIDYSINPDEIDISVLTGVGETHINDSNEILVGTIDFSEINNKVNEITVTNEFLASEPVDFNVVIDMSLMDKRWIELPVDVSTVDLPEGVKVISTSVQSVQVVGPSASVMGIDKTAGYAVPVLDGIELTEGKQTVPAKIVLRTLTDSWVYGEYTVDIEVSETE